MQTPVETAARPAAQQGHGWWHFARHYVEMVVAMAAGMLVLGALVRGGLALAGFELSAERHPELASLEMAFSMSAGMALWMRHRGHGVRNTAEMCGAMFLPAAVLFPLLWLGAVPPDSLPVLEHLAMLPLMLLVMLRRRAEYGA
ncbi:hypothetical protein OG946_35075 [Streptomyces sp. NBC_01808]|uniref:hypothetical protein n=1 Tax=Streptomyces sp. NBC_01808 TaxID=2975947 RepID=UPI002DDC61DC|nr:hypothetical protein [Streptomyces sp. NBC_01808]WSA42138.1 hypothetical protein OG946_35075 [Streptomyces sp. NBC_01808]